MTERKLLHPKILYNDEEIEVPIIPLVEALFLACQPGEKEVVIKYLKLNGYIDIERETIRANSKK